MLYQDNRIASYGSALMYIKCKFESPSYFAICPLSLKSNIRVLLTCVTILFSILITLVGCSTEVKNRADLEDFASAFRLANKGMSIEPMLALYALDGSTDRTKAMLKNALLYEHGLPIHSINFEPLVGSPEEQISYTYEGIKYGPSIEPSYRMRVRYRTEDDFESLFTIGKNPQDMWQIVSSKPVEVSP